MRKIATLMAFLTVTACVMADDVTVRYIRPSTVITYFAEFQKNSSSPFAGKTLELTGNPGVILGRLEGAAQGLVPLGVTLIAHDSKGILEIKGPAEGVSEVKKYVSLFDVAPQRVSLAIETFCKVLNTDSQTKTILINNKKWSTEDELLRLGLTVATRINDDATITMSLEIRRGKTAKQTMVFRLKQGEVVTFYVNQSVAMAIGKDKPTKLVGQDVDTGDIDEPEVVLTLKANIMELPSASIANKN